MNPFQVDLGMCKYVCPKFCLNHKYNCSKQITSDNVGCCVLDAMCVHFAGGLETKYIQYKVYLTTDLFLFTLEQLSISLYLYLYIGQFT